MRLGKNEQNERSACFLRAGLEVNSLVLLRGGRTELEWYRDPYRRGEPQLLYSLSKSFTSVAVGIACDQGLLSPDDSVLSFFPDKLPANAPIPPNLAAMKVRHLLSMTAGHEDDIYPAVVASRDWAATFLAQPVPREPGTHYRYSTPSSYMLSAIVERAAGMNLVDFLMPRLFGPLGIGRPSWETCPLDVTAGGMGLSLPTEDVAKFGQMLLNGGIYEGRRILSEDYVRAASSEQSDNRFGVPGERIDSAQGYGYQFHLCRFGAYRGDGSFGQLCLVSPKHGLVAAANCAFPSMAKLQILLDRIFELAGEESAIGGRSQSLRDHEAVTAGTAIRSADPCGVAEHALPFEPGVRYRLDGNPDGLRAVVFRPTDFGFELTTDYGDERDGTLPFAFSSKLEAESVFVKDLMRHRQKIVTSVEKAENGEKGLRLKLHYIETPYIVTYTIAPADAGLHWRYAINVSFGFKTYETYARRS